MRIIFSLEELRKAELAKHSHLNHESMDNFNDFYGKCSLQLAVISQCVRGTVAATYSIPSIGSAAKEGK